MTFCYASVQHTTQPECRQPECRDTVSSVLVHPSQELSSHGILSPGKLNALLTRDVCETCMPLDLKQNCSSDFESFDSTTGHR